MWATFEDDVVVRLNVRKVITRIKRKMIRQEAAVCNPTRLCPHSIDETASHFQFDWAFSLGRPRTTGRYRALRDFIRKKIGICYVLTCSGIRPFRQPIWGKEKKYPRVNKLLTASGQTSHFWHLPWISNYLHPSPKSKLCKQRDEAFSSCPLYIFCFPADQAHRLQGIKCVPLPTWFE